MVYGEFTAFEWQVIRNLVVNAGQDKFYGSYPLMAQIATKVKDHMDSARKAEGFKRHTAEIVPSETELEKYGLSSKLETA